jgi:hypothetical protein
MNIGRCVTAMLLIVAVSTQARAAPRSVPWTFVVSGDSRNCGDVVMPSIAVGTQYSRARFYWHLGDLRFIRDFDQDYRQLNPNATIAEYLADAWIDAQRNQLEPFGDIPVIREQRLRDDPHDHRVRTYYHWSIDGIDFVSLDNASPEQFDAAQLQWLKGCSSGIAATRKSVPS